VSKAVVLAAGKGTRLQAITGDELPKPLVPVAGRTLIEHVLDRLHEAGATAALLVIGHRGEQIRERLAGYPLALRFAHQQVLNGTATAALLAREFAAADPFLLTYGDILTSAADYRGMWRLFGSAEGIDAVVGAKHVEDPWQGAAIYESGGRITRIVEKPPRGTSTTHWNSSGQYIFRPSIFAELERVPLSERGEYELTSAISQLIAAGRDARLYALADPWRDVGRPEDLAAAESIVDPSR
jgi:NDP-sugar pyrophosphorylase family protein